jgi:hypothetical protein
LRRTGECASHLLVATLVLAATVPGLSYRALWQDEVDTAERARTICESGVPRVIDRAGVASLNVGGEEIEDGDLHRYQPWLMFYLAAAGLCAADQLGASRDAAVRVPSVVLHAATSGLASWALTTSAGAPLALANLTGIALGLQSVRMVHNRTARYHALLDLLAVAGYAAIGALRRGRRGGRLALALVTIALIHVHTISGAALAFGLGVSAALVLARRLDWRGGEFRRALLASVAAPGALSLAGVLALSRPWAQSWGDELELPGFAGLGDFHGIVYGLLFWLGCGLWLRWRGHRRLGATLLAAWGAFVLAVALADVHSFTRPRYFLSLALCSLLWPVGFGLDGLSARERRGTMLAVLFATLVPDLGLGLLKLGSEPAFAPFQGVRLAVDDARKERAGIRQPLHEAIAKLRELAAPGDPILFDYVPQYANWYLPGWPIALMPDRSFRGGLNRDHSIWSRPVELPRWHLWYPEVGTGTWGCRDACDFSAQRYDPLTHRYVLRSELLDATVAMCPVAIWRTHRWNNAPFKNLEAAAFRPEGDRTQTLLLAAPCYQTDGLAPVDRAAERNRPPARPASRRCRGVGSVPGGRVCSAAARSRATTRSTLDRRSKRRRTLSRAARPMARPSSGQVRISRKRAVHCSAPSAK